MSQDIFNILMFPILLHYYIYKQFSLLFGYVNKIILMLFAFLLYLLYNRFHVYCCNIYDVNNV